jgi:hypothetical protein
LTSHLDEFVPVFQFVEKHSITIPASPARIYEAVSSVTAREIRLFRTLTWLRRFGRSGPESILNAPPDVPIVDVAVRTMFILLADDRPRELVLGAVVVSPRRARTAAKLTASQFKALMEPGYAKAAMNFLIVAGPGGCTLSTETRIWATDESARRRFGMYWRVIYPGSALIRRMWLRAIRKRAMGFTPV